MPTVSGVLRLGEAAGTAKAINRRLRGRARFFLWTGYIAAPILGAFVGETFWQASARGIPVGLIAGSFLFYLLTRAIGPYLTRKRFAALNLPLQYPMRMDISSDGLVYEVGGIRQIAQWPYVTDLFFEEGYWIFLVQGVSFFAPRRMFTGSQDEHNFIAAAVWQLSDGAKARSAEAVKFAKAI